MHTKSSAGIIRAGFAPLWVCVEVDSVDVLMQTIKSQPTPYIALKTRSLP